MKLMQLFTPFFAFVATSLTAHAQSKTIHIQGLAQQDSYKISSDIYIVQTQAIQVLLSNSTVERGSFGAHEDFEEFCSHQIKVPIGTVFSLNQLKDRRKNNGAISVAESEAIPFELTLEKRMPYDNKDCTTSVLPENFSARVLMNHIIREQLRFTHSPKTFYDLTVSTQGEVNIIRRDNQLYLVSDFNLSHLSAHAALYQQTRNSSQSQHQSTIDLQLRFVN